MTTMHERYEPPAEVPGLADYRTHQPTERRMTTTPATHRRDGDDYLHAMHGAELILGATEAKRLRGQTPEEIHRAVLTAKGVDITNRSANYVSARFSLLAENADYAQTMAEAKALIGEDRARNLQSRSAHEVRAGVLDELGAGRLHGHSHAYVAERFRIALEDAGVRTKSAAASEPSAGTSGDSSERNDRTARNDRGTSARRDARMAERRDAMQEMRQRARSTGPDWDRPLAMSRDQPAVGAHARQDGGHGRAAAKPAWMGNTTVTAGDLAPSTPASAPARARADSGRSRRDRGAPETPAWMGETAITAD